MTTEKKAPIKRKVELRDTPKKAVLKEEGETTIEKDPRTGKAVVKQNGKIIGAQG